MHSHRPSAELERELRRMTNDYTEAVLAEAPNENALYHQLEALRAELRKRDVTATNDRTAKEIHGRRQD